MNAVFRSCLYNEIDCDHWGNKCLLIASCKYYKKLSFMISRSVVNFTVRGENLNRKWPDFEFEFQKCTLVISVNSTMFHESERDVAKISALSFQKVPTLDVRKMLQGWFILYKVFFWWSSKCVWFLYFTVTRHFINACLHATPNVTQIHWMVCFGYSSAPYNCYVMFSSRVFFLVCS